MKVLIVDDDSICNFLSQKTFERMGIAEEIHIALNGAEAINLFNQYFQGSQMIPDIILLDLNMPVLDGFGFLEAFQKLPQGMKENVKIIIVTSSFNDNDKIRAEAMGISGYLSKPITQDKLLNALA